MSLQARLHHPLGERWIELLPRGVDEPLVVGRAVTADIQIPSATVGQRHCVLFVHEGRWVVQDIVGGASGTYVNGSRVQGATFLNVGDVITLGPNGGAPAIEIDPGGALQGRRGQPAAGPLSPSLPPVPTPAPESSWPVPAAGHPIYPPAYPPQAPQQPTATAGDWPTEMTPHYYSTPRRRRNEGGQGVWIGMVATLVITGVTGYLLYRNQQGSRVVIRPAQPSTQPDGATSVRVRPGETVPTLLRPSTRPVDGRKTPDPATAPTSAAGPGTDAATTRPQAVAPSDKGPDSEASETIASVTDDAAWQQVQAARHLNDEGKAIVLFDDYARTHPGVAADQLQAYIEAMVDRIWFERIDGLCEQREDLTKKIAEVDREIAEDKDDAYKKRVSIPLREQYAAQRRRIEEELKERMKYTGKAPNLLDDAELDRLRRARDPQHYAAWKGRVLTHLRRTHGQLPWVTNKSM